MAVSRSFGFLLALVMLAQAGFCSPTDCDGCSLDRGKSKLCGPHREAEKAGLKSAERGLQAELAKLRIEALEAAAELNREHPNAPSSGVAELLGEGLADGNPLVRRRALELLLSGQEPESAVKALSRAGEAVGDDLDDLREELAWHREASAKEKKKSGRSFELQRYFGTLKVLPEQLLALGYMPDDRSTKALPAFLKRKADRTPGACYVAACQGLLQLGSRPALEAVAKFLPKLEAYSQVERKREGFFTLLDATEEQLSYVGDEHLEQLLSALAALAEQSATDEVPDGLAEPDAWAQWLKRHAKEAPASLGKLQTVVWAELPPRESESEAGGGLIRNPAGG